MIFKVRARPYYHDIIFAIDAKQSAIERYLLKTGADPSLLETLRESLSRKKSFQGRTLQFDNGGLLIMTSIPIMGPHSIAMLAHECYHATCYILRGVGIPQTEDTEEAYAYLLQNILHQALDHVSKGWK